MPNEHDLSVGDMVRATPGSRIMIVEEVYAPIFMYRYRCTWNADGGQELHDAFRRDQLEHIARKRRVQPKAAEAKEHETLIAEDVTVKIQSTTPLSTDREVGRSEDRGGNATCEVLHRGADSPPCPK